jgi:hypothetical protein
MTTRTIGPTSTSPPMPAIRTTSLSEYVNESNSHDATPVLLRDMEAAQATLLKFRKHGRGTFLSSKEHADGDEPSV